MSDVSFWDLLFPLWFEQILWDLISLLVTFWYFFSLSGMHKCYVKKTIKGLFVILSSDCLQVWLFRASLERKPAAVGCPVCPISPTGHGRSHMVQWLLSSSGLAPILVWALPMGTCPQLGGICLVAVGWPGEHWTWSVDWLPSLSLGLWHHHDPSRWSGLLVDPSPLPDLFHSPQPVCYRACLIYAAVVPCCSLAANSSTFSSFQIENTAWDDGFFLIHFNITTLCVLNHKAFALSPLTQLWWDYYTP